MIDLYGVLQEQETINGELGLGVDYYKGEKAIHLLRVLIT